MLNNSIKNRNKTEQNHKETGNQDNSEVVIR